MHTEMWFTAYFVRYLIYRKAHAVINVVVVVITIIIKHNDNKVNLKGFSFEQPL